MLSLGVIKKKEASLDELMEVHKRTNTRDEGVRSSFSFFIMESSCWTRAWRLAVLVAGANGWL
jgi:hypothetical protein